MDGVDNAVPRKEESLIPRGAVLILFLCRLSPLFLVLFMIHELRKRAEREVGLRRLTNLPPTRCFGLRLGNKCDLIMRWTKKLWDLGL